MSPLSLRRHRADRLLSQEFAALRSRVLAAVRRRLAASGAAPEAVDLEGCYAQAWQGLYTAMLDGEEIANPAGWLVVVTLRRAIEEHRRLRSTSYAGFTDVSENGSEPDLAARLDDIGKLRHLFEALRGRLSERECQAASLCYLQGLSRAEAAQRMGLSPRRMRKLMEGDGGRAEGVAAKVGSLLKVIASGGWCEEQASSMRALAFGILDPAGPRYTLAKQHQSECAACRRYVLSLRGLAAVLPPLLIPKGCLAGAGAGAGMGAGAGTGAGSTAGVASGSGALGSGGVLVGSSAGGLAQPLAGSVAAKLAGAVTALGVAVSGGVLLPTAGRSAGWRVRGAEAAARAGVPSAGPGAAPAGAGSTLAAAWRPGQGGGGPSTLAGLGQMPSSSSPGVTVGASDEFGIESIGAHSSGMGTVPTTRRPATGRHGASGSTPAHPSKARPIALVAGTPPLLAAVVAQRGSRSGYGSPPGGTPTRSGTHDGAVRRQAEFSFE
ncbi:MAG: sigma-70 family RNA polymerase sigma factor [Solirubrobacteraceae bacterium]